MKTATITEAKNGLSALIDQVRAGESILLTDRGLPVARIEPVTTGADAVGRLRRLERSGVVTIGRTDAPVALARQRGPRLGPGVSAVEALLAERRTGR